MPKKGESMTEAENMNDNERLASALHLISQDKENLEKITNTVDKFFDNIHLEMEDWKLTMEEFNDGTRIFLRFQFLVKK
jgi:hypothetical protein